MRDGADAVLRGRTGGERELAVADGREKELQTPAAKNGLAVAEEDDGLLRVCVFKCC